MGNEKMTMTPEHIKITCEDQYQLSANFYQHVGTQKNTPILICPATGITKVFYHHFAIWLAEQGYDVLCFDFRGIGESLHGLLKHSKASIQDWGLFDIPAAIDTLIDKTHSDSVQIIGHSAGGQLLGIVENHNKVKNLVGIACSSGYVKGLKGRTKLLAPVMFKLIFPISNIVKGYGATKFIGMGENLPQHVAKQWAQFCSQPGYVYNALGKTIQVDFHPKIKSPITILWASDDEIATQDNVEDLLRLYPQALTQSIEIKPERFNHKFIGHMHMFKRSHQNIWPTIQQYLI